MALKLSILKFKILPDFRNTCTLSSKGSAHQLTWKKKEWYTLLNSNNLTQRYKHYCTIIFSSCHTPVEISILIKSEGHFWFK